MWYGFDGMHSIYLQSVPSIQHLCTPLLSLTLTCCVVCFFPLGVLTGAHMLCLFYYIKGSVKDSHFIWYHHPWFPPTWYHCWPYDSLYLHFFPYFLHLICESDSVIYNPLAQDLQIGRMVVEIISGLAMLYEEWLGMHVYGFICKTSSAVSAEKALTSQWKWVKGARCNTWDNAVGFGKKLMN